MVRHRGLGVVWRARLAACHAASLSATLYVPSPGCRSDENHATSLLCCCRKGLRKVVWCQATCWCQCAACCFTNGLYGCYCIPRLLTVYVRSAVVALIIGIGLVVLLWLFEAAAAATATATAQAAQAQLAQQGPPSAG
jgi:hypothetical protein